jgi:hypothetical protein
VAELVAILDVVVHQRIIMENFDRDGRIDGVLDRGALAGGDSHDHLGAQTFPATGRPVWRVTEVA